MKKIFAYIFLAFLNGCIHRVENIQSASQIAEVISISLNDSREWKINDFLEINKVVVLDSKIMISEVNKLVFHNDKILILDQKSKSVLRFSEDGLFEKRIHFVGEGPEEYLSITDFVVDKQNNDIIILDGVLGQQLLWYNWDGDFIKKQSLPFNCVNFEKTESGYILYCGNHQSKENSIDTEHFYNILLCDSNFDVFKREAPIPAFWNGRRWLFKNNTAFSRYGESSFCQMPMPNDNIIYKITDTGLELRYRFEFGDELQSLLRNAESFKEIWADVNNSEIPHNLNSYFENDRIIYFAVQKGSKIHQIVYDKVNKKDYSRAVELENLGRSFFPTEYHGEGDFLVHVLFPFFMSNSELENVIPENIRYDAKSGDNPILIFFNIKKEMNS